jgi:hypothetical protein
VLSGRSEWSQTFLNVDGSKTLEMSIEPVRVRRNGSWVPVDTVLKATSDGVEPRATVLPMRFSGGGKVPLARIGEGDRELAVSWPDPLPVPVLEGDTAVYREVLPDMDLRVTAHALGFSEVLVVRSRAAAADPRLTSLRFGLSSEGLKVSTSAGGGLVARDDRGDAVFEAPAPLMWDSSDMAETETAPNKDTKSQQVAPPKKGSDSAKTRVPETEEILPEGQGHAVMSVSISGSEMRVVPNQKMLASPATKLPIFIDPSWTGNVSGGGWTTVWSKHKTSSFWKNASALTNGSTYGSAGAGRTEDCSGCADHIIRSFFQMDMGAVRGKHILSATFRVEQRHSWTCSPKSNAKLWLTGAISSGTTWNKQPTWDGNYVAQTAANRKNGSIHGCNGPGTIEFNVTSMAARAAAGNWPTLTVGLRAVDEGSLSQWKRFNHASPKLAINYNTDPNGPSARLSDGKACATGAARPYVLTSVPILAAKQSDPDASQQSLTTSFHWWPLGGARNDTNKVSQASGNPSPVSKEIGCGSFRVRL